MNRKYDILIVDIIAFILLLLLATLFSSCGTEWAMVKLDKAPIQSSMYCKVRYPVDSFFKEGKTIIKTDTNYYPVYLPNGDSGSTDTIVQVIRKYFHTTDTVGVVNNSAMAEFKRKYEGLIGKVKEFIQTDIKRQEKNARLQDGRNAWRLIGIGAILIIIAFGLGYLLSKRKII